MGSTQKRLKEEDEENNTQLAKKEDAAGPVRKRPRKSRLLDEMPTSAHYQVSFLHKSVVTHVLSSSRHGYVITACTDGIVKFWKRTAVAPEEKERSNKDEEPPTPCLEFVKSFTAHMGRLVALCLDPTESMIASIGEDGLIKLYDVSTFDVTAMVKTEKKTLGQAACFVEDDSKDLLLAISDSADGAMHIYSTSSLQQIQTLKLHSKPVTCIAYNRHHKCCVTADEQGILEVWSTNAGSLPGEVVGAACTKANNHNLELPAKTSTDLYSLAKKKTYAKSISASNNYFCVFGADNKVRVFQFSTGKVLVRYDERLEVYASMGGTYEMDSIEYGKRAATEREMEDETPLPSHLVQMDPSEQYLFVSSMVGIKIIDWKKNKVLKIIGKADASQLRFLSFCVCLGDAKLDQQMQLARGAATSIAMEDMKKSNDSLVVALAYNQRRFYVFSQKDPVLEADKTDNVKRDIWNEAPTAQDQLLGSDGHGAAGKQQETFSKAIFRTSMGDIHIQLFPQVVKTLENFCGHARAGYYDNLIFHRIIQGFMLQTGDPMGDGTGGESIWGGEFEDEFVRELRHDRPFTVSMANAGPNTNGSQFFITTVPTPWLDNKHTVFGRVTKGMDICSAIERVKTDKNDKPLDEVRILSVDVD